MKYFTPLTVKQIVEQWFFLLSTIYKSMHTKYTQYMYSENIKWQDNLKVMSSAMT